MLPKIKKEENLNKNSFISISSYSSSNNIFNSKEKLNNKLSIKNNSKSIDIDDNNNIKSYKYNSYLLNLYIYNSPPLKEIKKVIKEYCFSNNINLNSNKKILITPLLNNSTRIDFPNEKILRGFNSYLCFLKYENIAFKNIIIKKDNLIQRFKSLNIFNNFTLPSLNKIKYDNKIKDDLCNKKKFIVKNINKIYKKNKNYEYRLIDDDKIIKDYYSKRMHIRNGSPYLSDEEKRRIDEFQNKSKFLNNKGFYTAVGNYSTPLKAIPNYVQMTPSENPSTHQFRIVDKLKWITKKGFIN